MKTYLRVIEDKETMSPHVDTINRLSLVLSQVSGVSMLSLISRHSRGGYAVRIEIADATLDDIAGKLEASGFRLVI